MTAATELIKANLDESQLAVGRRIKAFSELAGPMQPAPPDGQTYAVAYRGVDAVHGRGRAIRSLAIGAFAFIFELVVVLWVIQPSHRPPVEGGGFAVYANVFVVASIVIMEFLRVVNVLFVALTSILARDPVPVEPQAEQRIAFLTTIVPSKEPIDVVRGTLQAALRIRYDGILDVWILDEGDDPAVKSMCRELGVNHFTRRGREGYNQRSGRFKAKTKHGNYNAWVTEHGESYDVFLSVDPDHVPLPNYAERILGYFRDPDVAFVSGPQCYANDETFVTRAAEAQQFLFHSLIQRAANRFHVGMLVGTNNAIRLSALRAVDGLSDSVTEDMATGLKMHTSRNPATGRRWRSVYTPDVLAVGEGPSSWGDFFGQQMRWSRGTFDVVLTQFWRRIPRLSPGGALHYLLLATFYPSMALGWLFGAVNACLFLTVGVQGISVPVQLWLALYVDAAAIQLWLYLRNRRYNVSPYEAEGSSGLKGMLMSTVSAPMYAASFISSLLRLPAKFVVTPKGVSTSADSLLTFRRHLQWAGLLVVAVIVALVLGYLAPAVLMWPAVMLAACLFPPAAWIVERVLARDPEAVAPPADAVDEPGSVTTQTLQRAALDLQTRDVRPAPQRSWASAAPSRPGVGPRAVPPAWPRHRADVEPRPGVRHQVPLPPPPRHPGTGPRPAPRPLQPIRSALEHDPGASPTGARAPGPGNASDPRAIVRLARYSPTDGASTPPVRADRGRTSAATGAGPGPDQRLDHPIGLTRAESDVTASNGRVSSSDEQTGARTTEPASDADTAAVRVVALAAVAGAWTRPRDASPEEEA